MKNKTHKGKWIKHYEDWLTDGHNCQKVQTIFDFGKNSGKSIKSLAIKKDTNVKITSRFMNGKMLPFPKILLASFIYNIIDIFVFADDKTNFFFSNLM